ncbi:MAG: hypothetical protein V4677_06445 [Bacteroidota bacterium]
MYQIAAYIIYLSFSLITVLIVGKILHRNGKTFLFAECPDEQLSTSANNFLYMGYCLVNTGFAFHFLNSTSIITNLGQLLEFIARSQGIIFLSLGFMHIVNVILAPRIISFFLSKKLNQY